MSLLSWDHVGVIAGVATAVLAAVPPAALLGWVKDWRGIRAKTKLSLERIMRGLVAVESEQTRSRVQMERRISALEEETRRLRQEAIESDQNIDNRVTELFNAFHEHVDSSS